MKEESQAYVTCRVCSKPFKRIAPAHLKKHGLTMQEYCEIYNLGIGDTVSYEQRLLSSKSKDFTPYKRKELQEKVRELVSRDDYFQLPSLQKEFPQLMSQITVEFGSFQKALRESLDDPDPYIRKTEWREELILNKIRQLKSSETPLSPGYIYRNHPSLYNKATSLFKNWKKALVAAGIPKEEAYSSGKGNSQQKILKRMANFEFDFPDKKFPKDITSIAIHYFGSLEKARKELNQKRFEIGWTKEVIIKELHILMSQEKKEVTTTEIRHKNPNLYEAIKIVFGGLRNVKPLLKKAESQQDIA